MTSNQSIEIIFPRPKIVGLAPLITYVRTDVPLKRSDMPKKWLPPKRNLLPKIINTSTNNINVQNINSHEQTLTKSNNISDIESLPTPTTASVNTPMLYLTPPVMPPPMTPLETEINLMSQYDTQLSSINNSLDLYQFPELTFPS